MELVTEHRDVSNSHVTHTVTVMSLPQNKQRDDTESRRHQEDEAGVPGHRSSIHAVENSHRHTVGEILKEGKTGKQGPCKNRKKSILLLDKLRMILVAKFHFTLHPEVFFFQIHWAGLHLCGL